MDWGHDLPSQEASRSRERLFRELRRKRPHALRLADRSPEPCRAPWGSLVPGTVPRLQVTVIPLGCILAVPCATAVLSVCPLWPVEQDEDELPSCMRSPPRTEAVGRLRPPESRTRHELRWTDMKGLLVRGKDGGARPTRCSRAHGGQTDARK